ncbi:hypothetical protein E5F05_06710 [Deinococcus metallilatus]|uniref:ABC-type Na+ efflux pump permease subunit n=1 Tax=Deinococcus metallilatus TaxID=1211322 RepID=A0AAJ5JYY7_9DEIO|nr:hypothetical protein [Deinococcus metallilatus]MBB5294638.1 ABC-type Na+ efflux pump permease subunit [Deinococcus metallilatus]QBY07674.1 hypothetical protein E5F05_06710 [Deinococcus metallilatus]RXJ14090.1 hypothetical protein ERJ73_05545 [Deinococcus metallilatus]TLK30055.1 hypothetical protein FCS05_05860 [Deinococcus metallilatus]GMA15851.1 hypothetical protein GCM10025871_21820 [Deinococcus metallilatus]
MNATLPQPRPLAPLATRRRLVLMAVGGYTLFLLTVGLDSAFGLPDGLLIPLALVSMLLLFRGGIQLMKPSRLGLPEGRDHQMDERQWQRLAQAHITAYRLLGALFLLAVVYFLLAFKHHLPTPSTSFAWMSLYLGAIIFIPALPTAILAWTEPDPLEE